MSDYTLPSSICILGRQPALSLAELENLYDAPSISLASPHVAGLSLPVESIDFKRLGGSTRLGRVLSDVPSNQWKDVEKELAKILPKLAAELPEGKLQLGFSAFGIPVTPQKMIASGLTLKKIIRAKSNRSVRLIPNQETELNTAQVIHNHLTGQTGIEIIIVATSHGNTLLAQTIAVQDIDSYTERDRGRPKRDARVGMLPPKLAQIIINLASSPTRTKTDGAAHTILDPFCGTGVVLQEALLMGYNVYGTDLEPRMVSYSTDNLNWFTERYLVPGSYTVEQGDATAHQWPNPIDAVATETYLGRPFTSTPEPEILQTTIGDCNLIITKYLRNLYDQLQPGTQLCIAVPAWQTRPDQFRYLPLIDGLADLGYNRISFEHVRDEQLLYYREDQIVARQLLVITRK